MKVASWHSDLTLAVWLTQHWCITRVCAFHHIKPVKTQAKHACVWALMACLTGTSFWASSAAIYATRSGMHIIAQCSTLLRRQSKNSIFHKHFCRKIEKKTSRVFSTCYPVGNEISTISSTPPVVIPYSTWHLRTRNASMLTSPQIRSVCHAYLRGSCVTLSILVPSRCMKEKLYLTTWLRPSVPSVPLYCCTSYNFLNIFLSRSDSRFHVFNTNISSCNLYSYHRVLVLFSWTLNTTLYSSTTGTTEYSPFTYFPGFTMLRQPVGPAPRYFHGTSNDSPDALRVRTQYPAVLWVPRMYPKFQTSSKVKQAHYTFYLPRWPP